jgi:hypothetical protein
MVVCFEFPSGIRVIGKNLNFAVRAARDIFAAVWTHTTLAIAEKSPGAVPNNPLVEERVGR